MTGTDRRPYRQRTRADAAEATRRRIVDAFTECWRERWLDEITLEEVARRADVSVRTVIRQFGNKEGLFAGIYTDGAPQVFERRTVEPGDINGAIERLFENYELDGDATIRALAQEQRHSALAPMMNTGREAHRRIAASNFGPWLAPLSEMDQVKALDALVVVTDIYTWKLLRRDMGRSEPEARSIMRSLVQAVLTEFTRGG